MGSPDDVDGRTVAQFLALAFGLSWALALGLWAFGAPYDGGLGPLLLFMYGPAIAAVAVLRRNDESVLARTGIQLGRDRWRSVGWIVAAWLAPLGILAGTVATGIALPGIELTTDVAAFLAEQGLPEEQIDQTVEALESLPFPPWVLFVGTSLLAGGTINAVAAFGEELGWRGFLLDELAPLGFWRASVVTGVVWGLWHAPVIVQGHNFPTAPYLGIALMTVATVAISPVYTYLTVRAQSVFAPTLFHGSFNALGSLAVLYLTGASNVWIAPVGVAGIVTALAGVAFCVLHDRLVAAEPITTGEPLEPWGGEPASPAGADEPAASRAGSE